MTNIKPDISKKIHQDSLQSFILEQIPTEMVL